MKGRDAAKALIKMAEWRVNKIEQVESVRGERADPLRRELGAIRVALRFLNVPIEVIPDMPSIPAHLRDKREWR